MSDISKINQDLIEEIRELKQTVNKINNKVDEIVEILHSLVVVDEDSNLDEDLLNEEVEWFDYENRFGEDQDES